MIFFLDIFCHKEQTQIFFFLIYIRFTNRDGIDFSDAQSMQAVQVFAH